jgi:hypothetical protein
LGSLALYRFKYFFHSVGHDFFKTSSSKLMGHLSYYVPYGGSVCLSAQLKSNVEIRP